MPENVEAVIQHDRTLPPIKVDPGQLAQVFDNIILNAIQAMPNGGKVVVRSEIVGCDWIAVQIEDAGVGIHEDHLKKVFEPLFTTKARGIGIGLALVKLLVELHSGASEVRSEMGKGSAFTVEMPVGAGEEEHGEEEGLYVVQTALS